MQGAKRLTLVLREDELRGSSLQLIDCHSCHIYALAPMRTCELLGCTACTIVCGAVSSVLSVVHCDRLRVLCTSRGVRLANVQDVTCHLCVNSPPLIWGENHRLLLAPLGIVYAGLAAHMACAGVLAPLVHNLWRRPVSFSVVAAFDGSPECGGLQNAAASTKWALLPPARFLPFHVPVDAPPGAANCGLSERPHCELPGEYAAALLGHTQRLGLFLDEIAQLACTDKRRRQMRAALHDGFGGWLMRTGSTRLIVDLMAW